jgi:hypothetical protein
MPLRYGIESVGRWVLIRNDEIGDYLRGLRHSLNDLIPALASIVDMLTLFTDSLKEDNCYFPEVQRIEEKMQTILSTAQEITLENQRALRAEPTRLAFARN